MTAISETIYQTESHPGDSVTITRVGDKYKGDGFYNRADGLHTVQYVYSNFVGLLKIQATLSIDPEEKDWFSLPETEVSFTVDPDGTDPKSTAVNFTGNYVWIRAVIDNWTQGSVNKILLSH